MTIWSSDVACKLSGCTTAMQHSEYGVRPPSRGGKLTPHPSVTAIVSRANNSNHSNNNNESNSNSNNNNDDNNNNMGGVSAPASIRGGLTGVESAWADAASVGVGSRRSSGASAPASIRGHTRTLRHRGRTMRPSASGRVARAARRRQRATIARRRCGPARLCQGARSNHSNTNNNANNNASGDTSNNTNDNTNNDTNWVDAPHWISHP